MREHPKLAKNLLPTTAQGKAAANRMWETLTRKLNAAGPPKKEPRFWKKSFADQKFQTKKKLFLNKVSNKEKIITEEEQLIIEATGMEAAVDNLVCVGVTKFGNPKMKAFAQDVSDKCFVEEALNCVFEDDLAEGDSDGDHNTENESSTSVSAINSKNNNNAKSIDPMLQFLEQYLSEQKNHNKNMETKMDRIIQIQERFLALKEEQHQVSLALQRVELEIKTNQLNANKNKI